MIIERIDKINYRIFRDFSWPSDLPVFKRFNLIYGWNGSGKTTLSNIFRAIEKKQSITDGEFEVIVDGRRIKSAFLSTESSLPQTKVFNRDFVAENVFTSHGSVSPIFFLGEASVEKQKQIEIKKGQYAAKQIELASKQQVRITSESQFDSYCIDQARIVRELLRSSGQNPYNNYDKRNFKSKCESLVNEEGSKYLPSDEEKERLKKKKEATPKERLDFKLIPFLDLQALKKGVENLISQTIVSQVIESLKKDPDLAGWIRDGITIHKARTTTDCLFCDQPLPSQRLHRLEGHFNDDYKKFLTIIDQRILELQAEISMAEAFIFPDKAKLYEHLSAEYEQGCKKAKEQISSYIAFLRNASETLHTKRSRIFESISYTISVPSIDTAIFDGVKGVIARHNQETDNFHQSILEAREKLEECLVAEAMPIFLSKKTESYAAMYEEEEQKRSIQELHNEILNLEKEIIEYRKPADELNEELCSYLGRSELRFQIKDTGYQIIRYDQIADGLSEGEKTAIAFLYFLKTLKDKDFNLKDGIVVVDDPVSSLDANSLYHAFGFMKERTKESGQIFILTHNFSFFRQVKNWFNHLPNQKKKDISKRPAYFFMIECKAENGRACSFLTILDPLLYSYESEYHYIFSLIYKASKMASPTKFLDQFYHLPNIARRQLESFLAFRRPKDSGDLDKQLEQVAFNTAKKTRIIRFLHTHSHHIHFDGPEHDISILSETPQVLSDLLELIESEDKKHYDEMVAIIDPNKDGPEESLA